MLLAASVVVFSVLLRSLTDGKVLLASRHHGFVEELRHLVNHGVKSLDSESFLRLHEDQLEILEDKSHETFGKKHHYFVQYDSACLNMPCHQSTIAAVGGEKHYQYVSKRVGMTYATHDEMKDILASGLHNILSYIPMVPDTKISGHVVNHCNEYHEHKKIKKEKEMANAERDELGKQYLKGLRSEGVVNIDGNIDVDSLPPFPPSMQTFTPPKMPGRILVQVAALPLDELESMKVSIISIASSHGERNVLLDEHSFQHARPDEDIYFSLSVPYDDECAITSRLIRQLAEIPEVVRVDRKDEMVISNRWAKGICQTEVDVFQPITVHTGLDGTGQVVGVLDTGLDMSNCYFSDPDNAMKFNTLNSNHRKVIYYNDYADGTDDGGGHGSHVAGSVAGNSSKTYGDFVKYNGMAYEAKIAFFDIGNTAQGEGAIDVPSNLKTDAFDVLSAEAGAYVITNSWGSAGVNYYNSYCKQSDSYMYSNSKALLLFANGNSGDSGSGTVNSPAGAKNVLSVGASLNSKAVFDAYPQSVPEGVNGNFNSHWLGYFSSRGPTADGRRKPDVCAPGWWTVSAGAVSGATHESAATCTIATLQGTSMATPTVAGNIAMIRQYFTDGYYPTGVSVSGNGFTPSGALLKAMAIHSAKVMVGITKVDPTSGETSVVDFNMDTLALPSNDIGFGRLLLQRALSFNNPDPDYKIPNNPLSLFVVGASGSSGLPDSNLYAACPAPSGGATSYTSSDPNYLHYFFKTGKEGSDGGTNALRITLVWTDPPGEAVTNGNTKALVNELDIELLLCPESATVTSTGNSTNSANGCNSADSVASSMLMTGEDPEVINPVAMIEYSEGVLAERIYKVRVKCISINTAAAQPFSLVMSQKIFTLEDGDYNEKDDNPFYSDYKPNDISIGVVSRDATVIIVIFSLVALALGILSSIIYFAHKKADAQDEADLDAQAAQMAALQEQQMAQLQAERGTRRA